MHPHLGLLCILGELAPLSLYNVPLVGNFLCAESTLSDIYAATLAFFD